MSLSDLVRQSGLDCPLQIPGSSPRMTLSAPAEVALAGATFILFFFMKKNFLFLSLILSIILSSCSQRKSSESFTAMNTFMTINLYSTSAKKGQAACKEIKERIEELEGILSTTLPSSDIYHINHNSRFPQVLKPDLEKILEFSTLMYDKTEGAFNPALYPLIREWGFTQEEYKVPSDSRIKKLLANTDFSLISKAGFSAGKEIPEGMELDFGAVGKGYAADQALAILEKNGISSALLDFGGNIQTLGKKPDGSLWRVGIKNPWTGQAACALSVESKAIVTSGGYERYFEDEKGKRYIHIFDPKTGCPCEGDLESVTIISSKGSYADCLSTALFVMGKSAAIDWWKANPDFDFVLITKNKEVIYSQGLKGFIDFLYPFESLEMVEQVKQ